MDCIVVVIFVASVSSFILCSSQKDGAVKAIWIHLPLHMSKLYISGTHPWHWYVTQGLPFILSTHYFLLIAGWKKCKDRALQLVMLWTVMTYR